MSLYVFGIESSQQEAFGIENRFVRCGVVLTFGQFLEQRIRAAGMTQAGFGARVGLTRGQITNVTKGRRKPSARDLHRWADALDLDGDQRDQFVSLALIQHLKPELRPIGQAVFRRMERQRADLAASLAEIARLRSQLEGE